MSLRSKTDPNCDVPKGWSIASLVGPLVIALALPAMAAASPALQPHRAVYELKVTDIAPGRGISDVRGRIELSVEDVCDGWITSVRDRLVVIADGGQPINFETVSSSWEAKDAELFRFFHKSSAAGTTTEIFEGTAEKAQDGIAIDLTQPIVEQERISGDALFPMAHMAKVLGGAEAGRLRDDSLLFDGSEGATVFHVTAVIQPRQESLQSDAPTFGGGAWPIRIALYHGDSPVPSWEIDGPVGVNGVMGSFEIEMEDFSLTASLTDFTALPACR